MNQNKLVLSGDIISLDLGSARSGVARLNVVAKIPEPLEQIDMKDKDLETEVKELVLSYHASCVVVGLPRDIEGRETDQTRWVRDQVENLRHTLEVPVFEQDEAATTKKAEDIAQDGQSIDSVAAGIIAKDFIEEVAGGRIENVSI